MTSLDEGETDSKRTEVKLAASMAPIPNAIRQRTEFAAKANKAIRVCKVVTRPWRCSSGEVFTEWGFAVTRQMG